jgi:hypothetical protein
MSSFGRSDIRCCPLCDVTPSDSSALQPQQHIKSPIFSCCPHGLKARGDLPQRSPLRPWRPIPRSWHWLASVAGVSGVSCAGNGLYSRRLRNLRMKNHPRSMTNRESRGWGFRRMSLRANVFLLAAVQRHPDPSSEVRFFVRLRLASQGRVI